MGGYPYEERKTILDNHIKTKGNNRFMLDIVSYPLMYDGELINEYKKLAAAYKDSRSPSAEMTVRLQHIVKELRGRGLEDKIIGLLGGAK